MIEHDDQPFDATAYPTVRLRVPVATGLAIRGMDGDARIGNIAAPLSVHAASVDLTVDMHFPTMRIDDSLHIVQSQTESLHVVQVTCRHSKEFLE